MMANVPEYLAKHKMSEIFTELASRYCVSKASYPRSPPLSRAEPSSAIFYGSQVDGSTGAALSSLTEELATPAKRDKLRATVHRGVASPTARVVVGGCATIAIDSVKPAAKPYRMRTLPENLAEARGKGCLHCHSELDAVEGLSDVGLVAHLGSMSWLNRVHPVLRCAHLAFSRHRPMALAPDHIWLTVLQGLTEHLRLFPAEASEKLGCKFPTAATEAAAPFKTLNLEDAPD